jgi:hypothetical protein
MLRTLPIKQDRSNYIMKLVVEFSSEYFLKKISEIGYTFYSWFFTKGEILGYILAVFHFIISAGLVTLLIISHTLYPSVWLKLFVFICLFLIWLQHVVLDICIVTVWESQLTTGEITPFHRIVKDVLAMFNLSLKDYDAYLIITESVAVGCFALELISHLAVHLMTNKASSII